MSFFKNLFGKEERFVPAPTQSVPGLEPIVVQAIEILYTNAEDQKKAFEYSLKIQQLEPSSLGILALLAQSNGRVENLKDFDPEYVKTYQFYEEQIVPVFSNKKAAEKWVKSITESHHRTVS